MSQNQTLYDSLLKEYLGADRLNRVHYMKLEHDPEKLMLLADLSYDLDTPEMHKLFRYLYLNKKRIAPVAIRVFKPNGIGQQTVYAFVMASVSTDSPYRLPDEVFNALTGYMANKNDYWRDYPTPVFAIRALAKAMSSLNIT
jgi:hypothetical protein